MADVDARLHESWTVNAAAWTSAVRGGHIASRRAGTDDAVLAACAAVLSEADPGQGRRPRVLDVGCGEGWLARALATPTVDVLGVDGSAPLVAAARAHEAPTAARFAVATYHELTDDAECAPGPWDLVVCNFSLLGHPLAPLLASLADRLAPTGRLVIQTVHPRTVATDGPYEDGWREEDFAAFAQPFPSPMPWYARTMASWVNELSAGGLRIVRMVEPAHPDGGRPLSLLLLAARAE